MTDTGPLTDPTGRHENNQHNTEFGRPNPAPTMIKEINEMLLYEELARARIRDLHVTARGDRTWRHARPSRRSGRIGRWAAKQVRRSTR
ncbi:hypothetical protein [Amycolatopsis sp. 195334CR]|uniref:hypothetical protein n=1 Tax=Amycolatopsis sp. 195334CR TaxID=2814588 RepID=UPI001A8CFDF7|nr:hypothetical protein [Amycolatopsis sp. 195334CR]MBN6034274.1 hypothetical protein [Amycolatopsis sp. 195334CR]